MTITRTLCRTVISGFCIATFCKISAGYATEISPIIALGQENFSFEVADRGPGLKNIKFEPNVAGVLRLGISAYGFGIGYSFRGQEKDTKPENGKTNFEDWQLSYHSENWGVDTYYQVYDGFYTSNTQSIQTFPNTDFRNYGFLFRYALEKSAFTVGGLMDQSPAVIDTAAKSYLVFGYQNHHLDTDISLLQLENAGTDTNLENLRELRASSYKIGVGGGKYWVSESKFFFGGLADLIQTFGNYEYEGTTGTSSLSASTISFNIKFSTGYAGDSHRFGFSIVGDSTTLKSPGVGSIRPSSNKMYLYYRTVFNF